LHVPGAELIVLTSRDPAPDVLWRPDDAQVAGSDLGRLMAAVGAADYAALHAWSIADLGRFWREAIIDRCDVSYDGDPSPALADPAMPGATWFPNLRISYPEHAFRDRSDDDIAIRAAGELRDDETWTWGELREATRRIRAGLRAMGVGSGDPVAGYLPHVPETIACFLATASLGAVWTCCSPDLGAHTVLERLSQVRPAVLIAVDGYSYGGRRYDRSGVVREIVEALPSLTRTVHLGHLNRDEGDFGEVFGPTDEPLTFTRVGFAHPLWIVYSSGTTGAPKAIVHGHGGVLLEHLKMWRLQLDVRPGDCVLWYTTTGWMMWNLLVSALLADACVVCVDGSPGYPDMNRLWEVVERFGVTLLGTGAAYLHACVKAQLQPAHGRNLTRLRAVGATGSPLSSEGFRWVYRELPGEPWLFSVSGGTDVVSAFVGACPAEPVYDGELGAPALGVDAQAWNDDGQRVYDEVGELVIAQPMPSMPVGFWGDPTGERYREAYFETYPGVWRHGDWIRFTPRDTSVITGRSDATINREGIRIGTAEIYSAVLGLPEIADAMAVDVPPPSGEAASRLYLFVVPMPGVDLDAGLLARIRERVRADCSPRHVPDEIVAVEALPRTLTGKLLEVPVKRMMMGVDATTALSRDAVANTATLDWFTRFAKRHSSTHHDG